MTKNEIIDIHTAIQSSLSELKTKSRAEEVLDKVFKVLSVVSFAIFSWSISTIIENKTINREQDIKLLNYTQQHEKLELLVKDNTKSIQELNRSIYIDRSN